MSGHFPKVKGSAQLGRSDKMTCDMWGPITLWGTPIAYIYIYYFSRRRGGRMSHMSL